MIEHGVIVLTLAHQHFVHRLTWSAVDPCGWGVTASMLWSAMPSLNCPICLTQVVIYEPFFSIICQFTIKFFNIFLGLSFGDTFESLQLFMKTGIMLQAQDIHGASSESRMSLM